MNFCNEGVINCRPILLAGFDPSIPSIVSYDNNRHNIREI